MRARILVSTLALIAAALIAFAVPLAFSVRGLLTERALDALGSEARNVAAFIDGRARTCADVQLLTTLISADAGYLTLHATDGRRLFPLDGPDPAGVTQTVRQTASGGGATRVVDGELVAARRLSTAACGLQLVLHIERGGDALSDSVRTAWLAIGAVGAGVLAIAAAAATYQGRKLAAPFEALARSARQLGEGDFTHRAPRSELPEADAIAEALDATADRLGRTVQRGQAFAADAGHQLRTPLTALRLNLEVLEARDPEAAAAALAEADRLEATIDELVALTLLDRPDQDVDVATLVTQRVEAWKDHATAVGRDVVVQTVPTGSVQVRPAAMGQALQVLLDNAIEHGRGTITVRVAPTLPEPGPGAAAHADLGPDQPGVRISVLDEGPGIDGAVRTDGRAGADRGGGPLPLHGGRGLRLARSLVEAEGGRLLLESTSTGTAATIVLPSRRSEVEGPRPQDT